MKRIVLHTCLSLLATFSVASERLPVPQRGFISSQPTKPWEEGLICGNGTIGANALTVVLELPAEIDQLSVTGGTAKVDAADQANRRTIELPNAQAVSLVIELK